MNIMYVSAEVAPFAKSGGLGDVLGALPKAVAQSGHKVSVVMPKYARIIPQRYQQQMTYLGYFYVDVSWRHQYCGVFSLSQDGVDYYFLDNEFYFGGDSLYCFADNERFTYFSKACLDLVGYLGEKVDVIHTNDWSTGILPVLFDAFYRWQEFYRNIKLVYTIHNLKYQGWLNVHEAQDLTGLPEQFFRPDRVLKNGTVNYMKSGIVFSDAVTTVSPTYAEEIKRDEYSEYLGDVINRYAYKTEGILNGIDYSVYNPSTDEDLPYKYDSSNVKQAKTDNKLALQKELGLPQKADVCMIGLVSRLVEQKGLDLVDYIMEKMLNCEVQFVVLGTGESRYEDMFRYYQSKYPLKMSANITFNNQLAHKIYAACDLLLVPSRFEPCGLSQMIALKYGTLPLVRETGGLKDTVTSYNEQTKEGNGFSFANYNGDDLWYTVGRALNFYYERRQEWDNIQQAGMRCDYSWKESSAKYVALYQRLCGINAVTIKHPAHVAEVKQTSKAVVEVKQQSTAVAEVPNQSKAVTVTTTKKATAKKSSATTTKKSTSGSKSKTTSATKSKSTTTRKKSATPKDKE